MKLKTLKNKFPIYTDRLSISVLGVSNIDEYSKEIVKDYFLKYLDNKNILTLTPAEIKHKLGMLVNAYSSSLEFKYEFRLLIKVKGSSKICGGITLMPKQDSSNIELAYWVKPEYQGRGIATEAFSGIIKFIQEKIHSIKSVSVEIQEFNIPSIRVIEKCGFKRKSVYNGVYSRNIKYSLDWEN